MTKNTIDQPPAHNDENLVMPSEEETSPIVSGKQIFLPWLIAIAFFMQMLDGTILNTALPTIAKSLETDPLRMHFVIISYAVTVALIIPVSGWITDRFGMKKVFFWSIVIFTIGSFCCAFAFTLTELVAARILQGIGGALLFPVGRLIVMRTYPREQLLAILSFITMPGLVGPLIGPLLGGLIVQYASWHWIFLINIPIGILGAWLALRWIPDIEHDPEAHFDFLGFLLISGMMLSLTIGIEGFSELHLAPTLVFSLITGSILCVIAYGLHAYKARTPLFPLKVFRTRTFAVGIAGNLCSRLSGGALPFLTPLLLQVCFGFSPVKSGLTVMPFAAGALCSKYLVNRLVARYGYRILLTCNTILLAFLMMSLSLITMDTPYPVLIVIFLCIGASNAIHFSSANTLTLIDLPDHYAGSGNAMLSMSMQLSISVGVGVAATFLTLFKSYYGVQAQAETLQAFNATYLAVGLLVLASAFVFLFTPKNVGKVKMPTASAKKRSGQ